MCGGVKAPLTALADSGPYDAFLDDIAEKLFNQKIKDGYIHPGLYKQTADDIFKAISEGVGGDSFPHDDSRNTLLAYLRENVHAFSAAKSLTELQHFSQLLADNDGDFIKFRNALSDAGYKFNVVWLHTETETANAVGISADNWDKLSTTAECVQYTTAHDDKVRPKHAALDGLTLAITSPVLHSLWPPIDWLCRCHMIPGIASRITGDAQAGKLAMQALTNPLFAFNPGLSKIAFKDNHPYFEALGRLKELDAEKNYGLPSVQKLYDRFTFPKMPAMQSEAEYLTWWANQPKIEGTDNILVRDKLKTAIVFDSADTTGSKKVDHFFKEHILRKAAEKRWQYGGSFPMIVADPDEIWSVRDNNKLVNFYIKYFDDAPYVVVVNDKAGTITAETCYRLTQQRATELRRGALIYAKK